MIHDCVCDTCRRDKLVGTQDLSKNWKWYKEHYDEEISQFYLDLKQNSLNWFKKTMYSR